MSGLPPYRRETGVGARIHRLWSRVRFRDAFLASLIPLVGLGLLFAASLDDYLSSRDFDDWYSREQSLPLAFSARAKAIVMLPKSLHLRDAFAADARDAGIIRLEVPGQRWDSLEFEPPGVWAPWLNGQLRYGTTTMKVRFRKRGDNSVHWLTDKRSITVRTPKDEFYKSFRAFGLSGKEVLTSYLANQLGHYFGLVTPTTAVSPVFLNNRFYGTYRFVETVDESFLRPFDRMPGNIYSGDAAERGEYSKGVTRGLFANAALWRRASKNDRWTSDTVRQLPLLLKDVAGSTFEDHERMMNRLDRGEFSRLLAYLFLVGDPYHMDGIHNQLLYEDPSTQLLHPIPWDTRLLPLGHPEKPLSPLFRAVLRDPLVADSLMRIIARRLDGDGFLKTADSLLRATEARYGSYLEYDRLRVGLIPSVGNADDARSVLRGNAKLLRQWLASDEIAFASTPVAGGTVLDFETRGYVGADLVGLSFEGGTPGAATLRLDANLNGIADAADPIVALRPDSAGGSLQRRLAQPVTLYPGWETSQAAVRAGHMPYRLFLSGVPAGTRVVPMLVSRATGKPARVVPWTAGALVREGTAWHPWRFSQPSHRLHRLAGAVHLAETLKIPAGDTLVIEPGTTIHLAPDVSIISRGLVLARGTSTQPIRMLADSLTRPWGTFALQGHGADSSIFTNVEFATGGGALIDRIEYTGMVNVHRGDGSVWDHIYFHDNLRSDDSFHALHSRVHITNSRFVNANGDAIDFDISNGDIRDNVIEHSGNDGIDLMTSTPSIVNNRISGSGDKGISIGEASQPFIFNNVIDSCLIGIEVKDRSEPLILNNRLTRNGTGLRERRKNWRYGGGGWATVAQTVFEKNKVPRARDLYSRLTLNGVSGLDSSGSSRVVSTGDIAWLYRLKGIAPPTNVGPGVLPGWTPVAPELPIDEQTFKDDLARVSDGWSMTGGVNRLEKRRDALVAEVQRRPGTISRRVKWTVPAGGTLVLELSGHDLASARIVLSGPAGSTAFPFSTGGDLATARFVTVAVPAGAYDRLAIEIEPVPGLTKVDPKGLTVLRGGRLDLRGFRLLAAAATVVTPTGARQ